MGAGSGDAWETSTRNAKPGGESSGLSRGETARWQTVGKSRLAEAERSNAIGKPVAAVDQACLHSDLDLTLSKASGWRRRERFSILAPRAEGAGRAVGSTTWRLAYSHKHLATVRYPTVPRGRWFI